MIRRWVPAFEGTGRYEPLAWTTSMYEWDTVGRIAIVVAIGISAVLCACTGWRDTASVQRKYTRHADMVLRDLDLFFQTRV